jgi:predicted alpha/beta-hydrolase family hydrolase
MSTTVRTVATPYGDARLLTDRSRRPVAALALGHGAGGGVGSPDLAALASELPRQGITVFRIEQPWSVAGKRVAPRPQALDLATVACLNAIRVRCPLVLGGRSAGARVACRLAAQMGAVGCLALAFPLRPPASPGVTRLPELMGVGLPTFVVQGERDRFGAPADFPESVDLAAIPDADHGFRVVRRAVLSQEETYALIVEAVVEWVNARVV